jgi:hypothetical protein
MEIHMGSLGIASSYSQTLPFWLCDVQLSSTLIMLGPILDKLSACQVIEGHFLNILES